MFSCRTQYVVMPSSHTRDSTHLSVYTRADSIREYVHDSMSIRFAKGVVPAAQRGPREVQRVGCPQRYTVPSGRYTFEVSSAGGNGIPDTVYIDRYHTAYRDRWHFRDRTDTITVTLRDSIPYPVEVPIEVEKPIPRFYVNCTIGFWLLIIGIIIFIAKRLYLYR